MSILKIRDENGNIIEIPALKGEKGDKGDDGSIINLDQTYNPESENAQSGIAVAEALNKAVSTSLFEVVTIDANEEVEEEFTNILNDKSAFTDGKMVHYNTGEIIDSTNYSCTYDYISIPENARLFAHYAINQNKYVYPYIVYYDENKKFISSEDGSELTLTDYNGMSGAFYNVPQNARYIRMSIATDFMQNFDAIFLYVITEKYEENSINDITEPLFNVNVKMEDELTNILNDKSAFTDGKMVHYNTGEIIDSTNYSCTEGYISIPENTRLFANYTANSTIWAYPYIVYYDENKNFISSETGIDITQTDYNGMLGVFYNIPQNTRYIRMSITTNFMEHFDKIFLYLVTEKSNISVKVKGLIMPKSKIEGENIVFFGDSIFGMYRDDTSVANRFAEITGANVYNVGFGGCRMSVHPTSGYGEFSMWALADAIYNGDWTSQDAAASNGSNYFPEQLNVLKNIDFNTVDRIVIHYGTNDFTGNIQIDNADNPLDHTTLCGALRYSLEKLLTKYPHLRVYISAPAFRYWLNDNEVYPNTHTNGNGKLLTDFIDALADTAKEYGIPVLDNYHELGVNKLNVPTFIEDGAHHNETGRARLGYYIASKICTQL